MQSCYIDLHIRVAGIIMIGLPVDGGMGAEPEPVGVGSIEDNGRIPRALSRAAMRSVRASAVGSHGVQVPSPASEVLVGGREDRPCWKGRANFFVSWQSFFLQLDGAASIIALTGN